ncbi:hypothetical protein Dimus_005571 [Dionaea muscipula]
MAGRTRGSSQRTYRADESLSWSPDRKPSLGRGSPSPTTPHFRRGPPSPGIRPHRHRSPSPMGLSSPDPADFSSSEEMESLEAYVLPSEGDDQSDLEDGRVIPSNLLELSPILEGDGLPEASVSSGSRSSTLSPSAATLLFRALGDVCLAMVSSFSPSFCAEADRGLRGGDEVFGDALVVGGGEDDGAGGGVVLSAAAQRGALGDVPVASSDAIDVARMSSVVPEAVLRIGAEPENPVLLPSSSLSVGGQGPADAESKLGAATWLYGPISLGVVGGGMVSEEGRVLPMAREALRPQPTDGLRQPSSAPVEPVRLAPTTGLRRGGEVTGGREEWLTVYPDALKKASERVRARRLVRRLAMAKMMDGEFQEKLGCRRSGRLFSPAVPIVDAVGFGRSTDLKSIEEDVESEGAQDIHGADLVDLIVDPVKLICGSAPQSVEDSDNPGILMRASLVLGDGADDSCTEPIPLLPVSEEAMTEAGA